MNKNKILPISLFTIFLIGTISVLPNADAVERYTGTDASNMEIECRDGQVLIFKFTANNQLCTSAATAEMWERMGVGQIVRSPIDGNSVDQSTTTIETTTDVASTESHEIDSPDEQVEEGIAKEDIICKSELALMIRSSGSPACVQEDSIKELESRGWVIVEQSHEVIEYNDESNTGDDISVEIENQEKTNTGNEISVELEESVGLKSK